MGSENLICRMVGTAKLGCGASKYFAPTLNHFRQNGAVWLDSGAVIIEGLFLWFPTQASTREGEENAEFQV
jgi:hypothetical protein